MLGGTPLMVQEINSKSKKRKDQYFHQMNVDVKCGIADEPNSE